MESKGMAKAKWIKKTARMRKQIIENEMKIRSQRVRESNKHAYEMYNSLNNDIQEISSLRDWDNICSLYCLYVLRILINMCM